MELVLACDLVVASRTARFGLPEVSRGVVASSGALFMAPRGLPANVARELLLTGEPIDADRGYAVGLVNQVTEPGDAVAAAVALGMRSCANAPVAVQASLVAVNRWLAAAEEFGWQVTADALATIGESQDYKEGIAAFLEKRAPRWTGR
jgi:enoyl-CoA hydratase